MIKQGKLINRINDDTEVENLLKRKITLIIQAVCNPPPQDLFELV
jgi:hypothetical protein